LAFSIKVNKLVVASMGSKKKPTDKEIMAFYKKNKDKFMMPETARARHILIKIEPGDTDKVKAEKKAKAEDLRKQLLGGANFAELAVKNSDDASKVSGGDLGVFARGMMVKPFEDAAFSQKIGEIGPVIETEFGYHIILVTERSAPKPIPLDKDIKARIAAFLNGQKLQEAHDALIKSLREKANVVIYKEP
jgi:peptidyl-prolyl cis-trans isomerase C